MRDSKFRHSIAWVLLASLILGQGCSSAQKINSEEYTPSPELLKAKADEPVIRLWDRWEEKKSSSYRLQDGTLLSEVSIHSFLADDPSPVVHSELKRQQNLKLGTVASALGFTILAIAAISAMTSDKPSSPGEKWGYAGGAIAFLGLAITFDELSDLHFENAISAHNQRIAEKTANGSAP